MRVRQWKIMRKKRNDLSRRAMLSTLAAVPARNFRFGADFGPSPTTLVRPLPPAFLPFGQSSLSAHLRRCRSTAI
jgi:hypothetical protein